MSWSRALSASKHALVLAVLLDGRQSRAEAGAPPAPSEAAKPPANAFSTFLDGQRAFEAGDYLLAAGLFEAANRLAPHPDVLWNAARAWDRAGETTRAANLYDRYLREAPAGARDRDSALQAVSRLAARLGRIEVVSPGVSDVAVDEQPLSSAHVYVTPGAHVIRGRAGGEPRTKTVTVAAGEALSVALVAEAIAPTPAPASRSLPPITATAPAPTPPPPWLPGWRRVAVGAGLGATTISAGLLVWSGVDTVAARATFTRERTPQGLEDGRAKEARTNVLVATTAALGAITVAATLVLTVGHRAPVEVRAGLAIGGSSLPSLALAGRF